MRDRPTPCNHVESRRILGMRVDCLGYPEAVDLINRLSREKRGASVCVATVHMVMEAYDDPDYRRLVNAADLVTSDGVPLVWSLKLLGLENAERVYGPTLTLMLCAEAEATGSRVGFLGGSEDTLAALERQLLEDWPNLDIVFSDAPPFRPGTAAEDATLVAAIEDAGVDLLFVGLGCPKQERWMAEHRDRLHCTSVGVGAAFDFIAGAKRQAPNWVQKAGLEWLFRLLTEPRRLWRRYLYNNPRFLWAFAGQLCRERLARRTAICAQTPESPARERAQHGSRHVKRRKRVLVTGAGGFIGHHLVNALVDQGYWVRGVDIKEPDFEPSIAQEFELLDLRRWENCRKASEQIDEVYNLAANMGGIGFISANKAEIMHDNVLINIHMLEAARQRGVSRYLYTSSACIYPMYRQTEPDCAGLKEEDAYPADAEDGYGWEKLFSERQCTHYYEDYGFETRIVRFHNIFGPLGSYEGGREKSPAAICRKIALAGPGDEIEIWGDGKQTRSYCYIDDCVEGILRLMRSDHREPLNLGQDRMLSIDDLVTLIAEIAEKDIKRRYDLHKPQGVRGRNSDNRRLREVLAWVPQISLERGLELTYRWIEAQIEKRMD